MKVGNETILRGFPAEPKDPLLDWLDVTPPTSTADVYGRLTMAWSMPGDHLYNAKILELIATAFVRDEKNRHKHNLKDGNRHVMKVEGILISQFDELKQRRDHDQALTLCI